MNLQSAIDAGLFVQFVANDWNSAGNTTDLDGRPVVNADQTPIVAGASYHVLKTIYAFDLATDIGVKLGRQRGWTTMGIVAQNDANPNDMVVAIRGTLTVWEWIQDGKFLYKPFHKVPSAGMTEDGFTDMYLSFSFNCGTTPQNFLDDLVALLPATPRDPPAPEPPASDPPGPRFTVAGHSLGSALATLCALDIAANTTYPVVLYTLASPRVGDLTFKNLFDHVVPNTYRIANRLDMVPKVPPPLFYYHVGDETELIPPGELKFDLGCEHHLTSYFNMLGTLISPAVQAAYPIQTDCAVGNPATPARTGS